MCHGSSILHNVLASSQIADTYSSYLVVFPAVDLDDLLTMGDVTAVTGGAGWVSGRSGSVEAGSGSKVSVVGVSSDRSCIVGGAVMLSCAMGGSAVGVLSQVG